MDETKKSIEKVIEHEIFEKAFEKINSYHKTLLKINLTGLEIYTAINAFKIFSESCARMLTEEKDKEKQVDILATISIMKNLIEKFEKILKEKITKIKK